MSIVEVEAESRLSLSAAAQELGVRAHQTRWAALRLEARGELVLLRPAAGVRLILISRSDLPALRQELARRRRLVEG